MPNPLSPILRPFGLDPSQGFDTAAAGAREAQGQANALSDLQWQRQMQGLNQAQGFTNQLQQLYNSIYSPGGGAPAAGGTYAPAGGGGGSAMGMLMPQRPPQQAPQMPKMNNWAMDALDFAPGIGQMSRLATFAHDPSLSTGARAAASFVPGANLAYDEVRTAAKGAKALWDKVF